MTASTQSLVELVADAVKQHPQRAALELPQEAISYQRLWELSGRIASQLLSAVEAPGRVGIYAGRSAAAYGGYLAALRLGATVVPMNPRFPALRNAGMASAAGVDIVVGDRPGAPDWVGSGSRGALPYVCPVTGPSGSDPVPPSATAPTDIAYIAFTSGTSGRPKGVPIAHGNVLAYLGEVIARYRLGPGCRLTQNFELTFDVSVFDLFATWGSGATLVVPSPEERFLPVDYVVRRRITHWFSVPSAVSHARRTRQLRPGAMPDLRWSLFIGEQLTLEQARLWAHAAPGSVLENVYGPTEATVHCTAYRLPADIALWPRTGNGTVPIGVATNGIECLVVDGTGQPAADGELCLRGAQRFGGYLDPADNDSRFLRWDGVRSAEVYRAGAPLTNDHWYRTGDRVRYDNGVLVHLGRLDRQVNVRGHRIELAEVEAALRLLAGVETAAVVRRETADGGELVGVYTGRSLPEADVLAAVRDRLPDDMVPATVRWCESLPLNRNGKIDYGLVASLAQRRADPPTGGAGSR